MAAHLPGTPFPNAFIYKNNSICVFLYMESSTASTSAYFIVTIQYYIYPYSIYTYHVIEGLYEAGDP